MYWYVHDASNAVNANGVRVNNGQPFTGTTRNAASCAVADVQTQVDAAGDLDIIAIPACSQTNWSTPLVINDKSLWIKGAGEGVTIIGDNVSKGAAGCAAPHDPAINWTLNGTKIARLSDFTMNAVTGIDQFGCGGYPDIQLGGTAQFNGSSASGFRIDHVTITNIQTTGISIEGRATGLIDHVTCSYDSKTCFRAVHTTWGGSDWGDGSWTAATDWGSYQAVYVEDSECTNTNTNNHTGCIDNYDGGRGVFRFNTLNDDAWVVHGTDSHQRGRSARKTEVYGNLFTIDVDQNMQDMGWCRGGTCVMWGNDLNGRLDSAVFNVLNCRTSPGCGSSQTSWPPWGACDGTSVWDGNGAGGYRCLDQPGSGQSVDLGGMSTPDNEAANNALDPMYVWMNRKDGSYRNDIHNTQANVTVANRDYYLGVSGTQTSQASPFNGTSGVGWGTLVNRPSNCSGQVGYFATDQGSWNRSGTNPKGRQMNGADGVFYRCQSGSWVVHHTPYLYPHLLQVLMGN